MRVLISAAPADRALGQRISAELSAAGFDIWFDADSGASEQWWQRSTDAVNATDVFVTVWTPNLHSAQPAVPAATLLHHARAAGKPIVAVQAERGDRPPAAFGLTVPTVEYGAGDLPATVRGVGGQGVPAPPPPPHYPPPGYGYPPYPPPVRSTRGRTIGILSALAAVVVIAVVVSVVLLTRTAAETPTAGSTPTTTTSAAEPDTDDAVVHLVDDGVLVGSRQAPVTIDVFNDALCPACRQFVSSYGGEMWDAVQDKQIRVRLHLLDMLDSSSASGDYSSRAAAAVYCVAGDTDVSTFEDFYAGLFASDYQPAEAGGSDRSDEELAELAAESGAPESAAACITGTDDDASAAQRTAAASATFDDLGGSGVPSVYDGQRAVDIRDGWLDTLIR